MSEKISENYDLPESENPDFLIDYAGVLKILPHRHPFLFIDGVVSFEKEKSIVGQKNFSFNEHFFVGHFPDEKVMPGVLIIEAMAQAGCVYFYYSKGLQGKDLIYYLAKVTSKFHQTVVPGDQLKIEVTTIKMMKLVGFLKTKVFVKDKLVAEAEIGFGVKET